MTIDIFQYSNMYTLRKSVQWLADELHVKDECGPYVTKPGNLHCHFGCICLSTPRKIDSRLAETFTFVLEIQTRKDGIRMDGELRRA